MTQFLNFTLSGLTLGVVYAAFALCLVLIFRATHVVNFAQGAQAMFTAYLALELIQRGDSYWVALPAALVAGFLLGAFVERVIVRPVENGPEINPVIVTLGLSVAIEALAAIMFGNVLEAFPAPFSLTGVSVGDTTIALTPNDVYKYVAVLVALVLLLLLFSATSLGLRMRAAAFGQEVARLLGVRVGRMLTLGWALAGLFGSLAGVLIAGGGVVSPQFMQGAVVFGFVAAVLGGLDSFIGAIVGGLVLGLTSSYVSGYIGSELVTLAALAILVAVLLLKPSGLFSSSVARKV